MFGLIKIIVMWELKGGMLSNFNFLKSLLHHNISIFPPSYCCCFSHTALSNHVDCAGG